MHEKEITERLKELESKNLSRKQIFYTFYLERYPIFEITSILGMTADELKGLDNELKVFLSRCPVGHKFSDDPCLHTEGAHYCVECRRWFDETTLKDEIELEFKRLKEKEEASRRL